MVRTVPYPYPETDISLRKGDRVTADDDRLRVGTAEKESVARLLGSAMAEGRLTLAEYEDRVGHVWASTTRGELARVTFDLPAVIDDSGTPPERVQWREYLDEWKEWIGVAVLLVGIWGITSVAQGEPAYFWPIWPLGIWGLVLVASLFWNDDDDDDEDEDDDGEEEPKALGNR